jgi:hypothetical protein
MSVKSATGDVLRDAMDALVQTIPRAGVKSPCTASRAPDAQENPVASQREKWLF